MYNYNSTITNYGNFIFNSKNTEVPIFNYKIDNKCNMDFNAVTLNNSNILNSKGNMNLNNVNMTGGSLTNKGSLSIAGNKTSFSNNPQVTNYGDLKIAGDVNGSGLVIEKLDAKVTASKVSMYYGATKYITIKVVDSKGNPIKNTKFTVTINKKNYQATSNANGVATVKVPVLNVGSYTVTIKSENPYCNNIAAIKTTVKVNKAKTSVKAPKKTFKYKKSKKFTITVKSKVAKKAVSKVKIKVKVYTGKKYKVYKLKTNKKGVAKLNTKKLKKGKHKMVISSLNKNYQIRKKSLIRIK